MPMKTPRTTQAQKAVRAKRSVGLCEGAQPVWVRALVEFCRDEDAAQKRGEAGAEGCEDDDGQDESQQSREEAGELEEHSVSGLAECEFDLLPHGVVSLRGLVGWRYGLKRSGQRQRETK
jgi:hypothetical protein